MLLIAFNQHFKEKKIILLSIHLDLICPYQVVLMENPGLTIPPCEVLNPATILPTPKGSLLFHSCLETLDHWTKPREGLSEDPLTNPEEIWYTDGSSFILDGKRRAG